jgi:hypothetical protein
VSRPLRWGVLSTAAIAEVVVAANAGSERTRFAAVASRSAERAAGFAEKFGIENSFGSYDAMLADDGLDAVYLPLPVSLHSEWTVKALRAGKHVLCEKPFAVTRRDALACARAGVPDGGDGGDGDEDAVYRVEFDTVSAALRSGQPLEFELPDAVDQAATLAALAESARTGRPAMVERHGGIAPNPFSPEDVHVPAVP